MICGIILCFGDGGGEGVWREVNLSGYTSAVLSFNFRRDGLDNANDAGIVFASGDGGGSWSPELARYEGPDNDTVYQFDYIDISAYIASNTRIKFQTGTGNGGMDRVCSIMFRSARIKRCRGLADF